MADELSRLKAELSSMNGDDRARTDNPRLAKPVLSQLSYVPRESHQLPAIGQ